jgi:two-component system LytT family response regulator
MIRCIVIDDEPYARQLLTEFIARLPNLRSEGAFSSALSALTVLQTRPVDVIFLDIQMPDISGIDFLKSLDKKPGIIFTTAFAEYALEGFELDVIDYLLKPFDFNRFLKAVNKVSQRLEKMAAVPEPSEKNTDKPDFIFVKDGSKLVKVELKKILFIKGSREYVTIHTQDKKIMSLQTLRTLETELPQEFARVHNSYIVNIPSVGTISKNEVEIEGEIIPIGITYKKSFAERLKKYFPGKSFNE